jgi:hypothetical protein
VVEVQSKGTVLWNAKLLEQLGCVKVESLACKLRQHTSQPNNEKKKFTKELGLWCMTRIKQKYTCAVRGRRLMCKSYRCKKKIIIHVRNVREGNLD